MENLKNETRRFEVYDVLTNEVIDVKTHPHFKEYGVVFELDGHVILTHMGDIVCSADERYHVREVPAHVTPKLKVKSADVVVRGIDNKPYYEIKYTTMEGELNIGYGSYDLRNVLAWLDQCFEVEDKLIGLQN